jgi:hypothetical protein
MFYSPISEFARVFFVLYENFISIFEKNKIKLIPVDSIEEEDDGFPFIIY